MQTFVGIEFDTSPTFYLEILTSFLHA